nr:hypothetical protein [Tanacetum cinerariifolium]
MIFSGVDNRPPMLEKDLYDSWKSKIELYMQNREHGRMILESVEHGLLIWPTIEENEVTRTKKYVEFSAAKKIQADCDMKATDIILQGIPPDIYSLFNHHRFTNDLWERIQLLMQDLGVPDGQAIQTIFPNNIAFQTKDLDTYDSDCDDISMEKQFSWPTFLSMVLMLSQSKPSDALPIKAEAPKELPKISLVNESLKKHKFHLAKFDNVVKIRTTPKALQKELLLEDDRLLQQIMSQDVLLNVMNYMSFIGDSVNKDENSLESSNLESELLKSQNAFNDLLKSYSQLKKNHCISLECSIQLNQEIFQKCESCDNQNALEILEFFKNNDLKAQLQDKDSTICKLKDIRKSLREKSKEENVNYDYGEIEKKCGT